MMAPLTNTSCVQKYKKMIFEIIEDIFNAAKWPVAVVVFDKFVLQKIPIPEYVKKNHVM